MNDRTRVVATHLEGELVRLEFAHSHLVSDHPDYMGGGGKGPTPGDMTCAGLMAASVFGLIDEAARRDVSLGAVVARYAWRIDREAIDGPTEGIGRLGRIWRRIEMEGALHGLDPSLLLADVGLREALRQGTPIEERVTFSTSGRPRPAIPEKNKVFQHYQAETVQLASGARLPGAVGTPRWRGAVTRLDDDHLMVNFLGAPVCVSRRGGVNEGPTPLELFLAGVAGCTAIYLGRNAPLHDIPLERATVTISADTPLDYAQPVRNIVKVSEVVGSLTAEEQAKCRFFADYCALGETVKRGAEIVDDIEVFETSAPTAWRSPFAHLARAIPAPEDCDDGSCCVVAGALQTA